MAIYTANASSEWIGRQPGLWLVEYTFSSTPLVVGDTIVMMSSNRHGFRLADWFIGCDQLDSNVSPTLSFDLGCLNNAGTAFESGGVLKTGWTGGRSANGDFLRADNHVHLIDPWPQRRLGFLVNAAAATWAGSGTKRIRLGLHLLDY